MQRQVFQLVIICLVAQSAVAWSSSLLLFKKDPSVFEAFVADRWRPAWPVDY
jgi:hypothetical protein